MPKAEDRQRTPSPMPSGSAPNLQWGATVEVTWLASTRVVPEWK